MSLSIPPVCTPRIQGRARTAGLGQVQGLTPTREFGKRSVGGSVVCACVCVVWIGMWVRRCVVGCVRVGELWAGVFVAEDGVVYVCVGGVCVCVCV